MTIVVEQTKVMTVGELAVEVPTSIRIFEAWKIDYCCGGRTPLPEACAAVGRSVEEFVAELDRAAAVPDASAQNWSQETLASMSTNIVSMYHVYTREELQTIAPLANKVLSVHGERRPELAEVVALVSDVTNDMLPHMLKEEQVLFPYVQQLEASVTAGQPAPTPFFGTVKNPVRMMMLEHDRVAFFVVITFSRAAGTSTSTSRTTSSSRAPLRSKRRPEAHRRSRSPAGRAAHPAATDIACSVCGHAHTARIHAIPAIHLSARLGFGQEQLFEF